MYLCHKVRWPRLYCFVCFREPHFNCALNSDPFLHKNAGFFLQKVLRTTVKTRCGKTTKSVHPAIALNSLGALPYLNDVAPARSGTRNSIKQEYYIPAYSSCWKWHGDAVLLRAGVWPLVALLRSVCFKLPYFVASCIIPFVFARRPMVSEGCTEIISIAWKVGYPLSYRTIFICD